MDFLITFKWKFPISNFMKICPVGAELTYLNIRTGWYIEAKSKGLTNLWHAAFTAVPIFLFLLTNECLYTMKNMCVCVCVVCACVYKILQSIFLHKSGAVRCAGPWPGGNCTHTWHWTERSSFETESSSSSSPSYDIYIYIAFLEEEVFARNMTIILWINYTIITVICINDNAVVLWKTPKPYFALQKFPRARERVSSQFIDNMGTRPHKGSTAL